MNVSLVFSIVLARGLLAASAILVQPANDPPMIINESASMAKGVYGRSGNVVDLKRGDVIAMAMHAPAKDYLVEELGYPEGTMLIKRVAGLSGDVMCRHNERVTINATTVYAARLDSRGNPLPYWQGCIALSPNEVFLLGDNPASFDSRYFGPVTASQISGTYKAVMTW
jgi:conjugative transfer signal peptidase TraF